MTAQSQIIDLFLCHNGTDKDWVRRLAEQVESETFDGLPSGRQLRVFFDEWDIDVGQNFLVRINEALRTARYLGVVISPEFLNAPWPTMEWTHVLADDPVNRKGRLIPLFHRDYSQSTGERADLPAPFKMLNWIDFRRPKQFKRSYQKLIRKIRDHLPARGRRRRPMASASAATNQIPSFRQDESAAPDSVHDVVLGNLLPVESCPRTVWSAPTEARKPDEVWSKVADCPAFVLREKRLYTFVDLSIATQPLRSLVDTRDIQSHAVNSWKDDPDRWRWFISLLNQCLRNHIGGLPIVRDGKGRYFFLPNTDGTPRQWQNGQDPARVVAAQKVSADGTRSFYVHQGASLMFQTLGDRVFLCVEPCYVFTTDGRELLTGKSVGSLAMKWGGKERNAAILRHIVFWTRTLARGRTKIEQATGANPVTLSGIPALARTTFGIEFDRIAFKALSAQVEDELSLVADAMFQEVLAPEEESGEGADDD